MDSDFPARPRYPEFIRVIIASATNLRLDLKQFYTRKWHQSARYLTWCNPSFPASHSGAMPFSGIKFDNETSCMIILVICNTVRVTIMWAEMRGRGLKDMLVYISYSHLFYPMQVSCYWKKCSSAPENCQVMEFEGACNPSLYICGEYSKDLIMIPMNLSLLFVIKSFAFSSYAKVTTLRNSLFPGSLAFIDKLFRSWFSI